MSMCSIKRCSVINLIYYGQQLISYVVVKSFLVEFPHFLTLQSKSARCMAKHTLAYYIHSSISPGEVL
jgi:hypothetical protein